MSRVIQINGHCIDPSTRRVMTPKQRVLLLSPYAVSRRVPGTRNRWDIWSDSRRRDRLFLGTARGAANAWAHAAVMLRA